MMKPISVWKQELSGGAHAARLAALYCCAPEQTPAQAARYEAVLDGLEATFGPHAEAGLYSAPGRTEIGGNHTDHQHGRVLAGSVNIDMIAAAGPNTLGQLRVQSEGYDLCVIDLNDLAARKEEENTSAAILRGEPLIAPGLEGIHGLTLSNAMHLSTWTDDWVEFPLNEKQYLRLLQQRISTSVAKETASVTLDASGTW